MMQENHTLLSHLELIHEMNRLFLSFLQDRAKRGCACLGLPASIGALLRAASDVQLDRAASLPHALFSLDLDLELRTTADAPVPRTSPEAIALYCLQISLLQSARNLCRANSHLAQTFLRLPARTLIQLRCLALIELTGVAATSRLACASFADEAWLWRKILSTGAPEDQRRLRLIALQPRAVDVAPGPVHAGTRIR
jgi:hypothetical protein